jgi:hypothetical protein
MDLFNMQYNQETPLSYDQSQMKISEFKITSIKASSDGKIMVCGFTNGTANV